MSRVPFDFFGDKIDIATCTIRSPMMIYQMSFRQNIFSYDSSSHRFLTVTISMIISVVPDADTDQL